MNDFDNWITLDSGMLKWEIIDSVWIKVKKG